MDLAIDAKKMLECEMNDLFKLKATGLSHIENNNFIEAVKVYKKILSQYPEDIESYLLLGDLYIANEDYPSAEKLYQKALSLEPDNAVIQRRVKLSTLELNIHASEEIPTDSESVSRFLQDLTGRPTPITDDEIQNAATLLNDIVHSHNPAEMVAKQLEKIDNLLPALIELNIRQARNDRRFDLVNMLQALLESISQLLVDSDAMSNKNENFNFLSSNKIKQDLIKDVSFLIPDMQKITERIKNFSDTLQKQECKVFFSDHETNSEEDKPDIVIACNPHVNPQIMEKLAKYSTQNIPIILDLDEDFEYMPINHPEYTIAGLGSLEKSRSFTAAMLFANLITVPGEAMASHIRESGYKVEVIPFGWSAKNDQWHKQPSRRSSINIGLIGIQGNFEDVQKYRRIIVRVLREFPQTRLVVCGDSVTYKMFENITENRRVFLPRVPDEDMLYILGQIDILLLPLNTTPYHSVATDQLLMQAGVKGIPWIASPIPDFIRWQAGGVTAENPDEWHSYLRQFIQDKELRLSLGQAGKDKANQREESILGARWMELINAVIANKKN